MKRTVLLTMVALSLTIGSTNGYSCYLSCAAAPPAAANTSGQQPWGGILWLLVSSVVGVPIAG